MNIHNTKEENIKINTKNCTDLHSFSPLVDKIVNGDYIFDGLMIFKALLFNLLCISVSSKYFIYHLD